ncbi:MAG: hypothetical protein ACRDPY_04085 [Streptosporangiaceae bacterium]
MIAADPISAPLTYPGEPPQAAAVLVLDGGTISLEPSPAEVGGWAAADGRTLDEVLAAASSATMENRTPVLAVGSNASPAQMLRKFARAGARAAVPITAVTVRGLTVGVSAHVSVPGYVPATPVPDPAAVSRLFVTWLDDEGLAVMDETEPNYDRAAVDPSCEVELAPGRPIAPCLLYVSKHGYLTDAAGAPRKLAGQAELISGLLADVPGLAALAGATVGEWMIRTQDACVRDEIRQLFRSAELVRPGDAVAVPDPEPDRSLAR